MQRAAEEDRRQMTLAERPQVKGLTEAARHLDLLAQRRDRRRRQSRRQRRVVEPAASDRLDELPAKAAFEEQERIAKHIVAAKKIASHADRPARRRRIERERLLDLVDE